MTIALSNFHCMKCHACCKETGYVRLRENEPDAIASFLKIDIHKFIADYTILTKDRTGLSLIEKEDKSCIFLTDIGCKINSIKPFQCREFPLGWKFSDFETICGWAIKTNRKSQSQNS
ncbi:MAG: YkgJ family cysteine cluster protein [Desulfobacteraceae bacterium]|nr:YkgJ family cysteine cluster protein [Desulfobacteraceae bacterium]